MTALDGEHDPLLTALRSARFDSLQDTTLLGFSPSEHSATGNAICCISVFERSSLIAGVGWEKMQLTRKNREDDEEEFHAAAYLWTSSSLVLLSLELLDCPPLASDGV